MPTRTLKAYQVWDRPTRSFHWINFVCVVAMAAIGTAILYSKTLGVDNNGKILLKTIHVWFGYVFVLNLAWRIVWAFIGNRHARWSALLPFRSGYRKAVSDYIAGAARGHAPAYLGHNPIGRLMVFLLLVVLFTQAVTGLVLAGTDIYYPPLGHWIAKWVAAPGVDPAAIVPYDKTGIAPDSWQSMRAFRKPFITVHYWTFFAILTAVFLHVAGVVATELRERGGIVSAMITGQKTLDKEPVDGPDHNA